LTKKFKKEYYEKKLLTLGRGLGKTSRNVLYSEFLKEKGIDQKFSIRGMEADLYIIDELWEANPRDFDLTMPCGPYGDED